jgi:hypothetical protein
VSERSRVYQDAFGVRRTLIVDDERPDRFVVKTEQDIEPVLEAVKRDRELMPQDGDNKVVATLPMIVVEDLIHRGIYFDEDAFKRWLNSPEATPWRKWPGRV